MLSLLFIRRPKTAAWGMLTATLVGMLFVPPFYVFFRRLAGVKEGK